ncbi:MAG TPA: CCA tRNA nucleotidyltransferase [Terriglobia bacterium]|nr:CCA tRNA nucleotidyltransferase [Terriglobia bacterium]
MSRDVALKILKALSKSGYETYFAGGCVRDLVLGIPPKDYDIATSARPEEVLKLFPRALTVGAHFGVLMVVEDGCSYEVTTFRSDGVYADGRHPQDVTYTSDPRLDVRRRDFTMNGLLYDPLRETIIDFVGGQEDIRNKLLRTIGDPQTRFLEDKLRLMRAVRFAARFDFRIDPETRSWILKLSPHLTEVSRERIRDELVRILTQGYAARGVQLLEDCQLLPQILPEVSQLKGVAQPPEFHPEGDVWRHTLLMLEHVDETRSEGPAKRIEAELVLPQPYPSTSLAMAVMLHDIGKPSTFEIKDRIRFNGHAEVGARMAASLCARLRLTNQESARIVELVKDHLMFKDLPGMRPSTVKRFLRRECFLEHLELHRLDCLGSHCNLDNWNLAVKLLKELGPEQIRPPRLLTGDDLIAMGFSPGKNFKEMLKTVEDSQLDGLINSAKQARQLILDRYGIHLKNSSKGNQVSNSLSHRNS